MSKLPSSSRKLAWLMDKSIPLPGGFRIGLDGLIGLIPGVGDFVSGLVSSWIILQAANAKLPKSVIFRMIINTLVDSLVGCIPIVGDLFDFVFKANSRNLALAERYKDAPARTQKRSLLYVLIVSLGILSACAFSLYVLYLFIAAIFSAING